MPGNHLHFLFISGNYIDLNIKKLQLLLVSLCRLHVKLSTTKKYSPFSINKSQTPFSFFTNKACQSLIVQFVKWYCAVLFLLSLQIKQTQFASKKMLSPTAFPVIVTWNCEVQLGSFWLLLRL